MRSIVIVNFNLGRELAKSPQTVGEALNHLSTAQKVVRSVGMHPSYLSTTIDEELENCRKKNLKVLPNDKIMNKQTQFTHRLLKMGQAGKAKGKDMKTSPYVGKGLLRAYLQDDSQDTPVTDLEQKHTGPVNHMAADEIEFDDQDGEEHSVDSQGNPFHQTQSVKSDNSLWKKKIVLPKEYEEEEEAIASIFEHKYKRNNLDGVRRPFSKGDENFDHTDEALEYWDALNADFSQG